MSDLSNIIIQAEIFKVIRANSDRPKKSILKSIQDHLPEVSIDEIHRAVNNLVGSE